MEMGVPSVWPSKVPERIWQVSLSLRGWAIERFHLLVGLGTLVLVADPDGDGRAERLAVEGAGEDLAGIAFLARLGDRALPSPCRPRDAGPRCGPRWRWACRASGRRRCRRGSGRYRFPCAA